MKPPRKPPRLPSGHPLAGFTTLSIDQHTRIWELLKDAGARTPDAENVEDRIFRTEGFFANLDADIARVVSRYLTARTFELPDPSYKQYREDLKRARDALDRMPPITSPVWPAIEARASEDMEAQGGEELAEIPEAFTAAARAVRALCDEEGIGQRTGAPAKRAKHQLVNELARLFEIYTGHDPRPGSRIFNAFEDFVDEVNKHTQVWLKPRLRDNAESYKFADGIEKSLREN
jgi:hypothetical protein